MGGGYLSLIYKLYKIKKEYTKEQKLYKQTIKLFPQLTYPRLETCYDYNESIKYKFHLSYMLGLVLINADKNKFKGGYLTLFKDIKKARKDYKNINSILKEFNIISSCVYEVIANNKDKFINNFEKIKEVLHTHKDYQAIIDNIFHNFDYFLNNFELIKEWLISDDFYQKYKKENHPYPSLLDPKKLNDENEQINYHNIPAELAWEMNLPLPNRYKFVFLFNSCSGSEAMHHFFYLCGVETRAWAWYNPDYIFKMNYYFLLNKGVAAPCLPTITTGNYRKNFFLFDQKFDIIFVVRDPISVIKTGLNHIESYAIPLDVLNRVRNIDFFDCNFEIMFPTIIYAYSHSSKVDIDDLEKLLDKDKIEYYFTLDKRIKMLQKYTRNIICLNSQDINSENIVSTIKKLSSQYNFIKYKAKYDFIFKTRINLHLGLLHLPVNIHYKTLQVIITTPYLLSYDLGLMNDYINITDKIFNSEIILQNVIIVCHKNQYNLLIDNEEWSNMKNYLKEYIKALEKYIKSCKNNLIDEKDILLYLENNASLAIQFKKYIDQNIKYIQKNYPQHVVTWKYHQEFEKMCEGLDEKEDSLKENISNN
ncbi:DUF2972 domain-containing protein [Campylobacter insulaenigrae]|uniref:DUF2972 domain-containing protein n=1 Tax=Campylobacter insulaenigrae TaxID=260714 RepID=A0ABY3G557_9BACT|nr:DUF2972 domain-containing protein [Campylobacter insulaenigrae]TWO26030.1 DUF2972 domain-containing protein [Campylobacter insulaenigrae]